MNEPTRNETQLGLADLKKRLAAAGLQIIEQRRMPGLLHSTYFVMGHANYSTDITIADTFLDDLPATKEYHTKVDSYAAAVAGRLKCGSPETFYCRNGFAVHISIRWPIQAGMINSAISSFILMDVTNQVDGQIAKCSLEIGLSPYRTVFDTLVLTVNSVRTAVDLGSVTFYSPDVWQEKYQRLELRKQQPEQPSQAEIERYLAGKACVLGFFAANDLSDVWTVDSWDSEYLAVTTKQLVLATRVLRAKGLLHLGSGPDYARPTDKLLAEWSSGKENSAPLSSGQRLSRTNLPNKEALLLLRALNW